MADEFGGDIYTITDEDGVEYSLEHVDTFEENDVYYLAFLPAYMNEDDPDYGIVLLKRLPGSEELENLSEDEEDRIYEIFMDRLFEDEEE